MLTPLSDSEGSRLARLSQLAIMDTPPEGVFDDVARLASLICDTPIAVVSFVDEKREWFKAKIGFDLDEIPRHESFGAHAILQGEILIFLDPSYEERFRGNFLVTQMGIKFYAGIPLVAFDGHALGTLAVMDRIPHLLTAEQIDSLRILARQIVSELELRSTREPPSPQRGVRPARSRQLSGNIMLVEDNDNLRLLLQRTLEGVGFSVFAAGDGAEALRLWQRHEGTISLVVTDIAIPQVNGVRLAERICAAHPDVKILFITGFADQFPELDELIKKGATILEKPFLPSELLGRVEEMVNPRNSATGTDG